jgi:hypothetical protein
MKDTTESIIIDELVTMNRSLTQLNENITILIELIERLEPIFKKDFEKQKRE